MSYLAPYSRSPSVYTLLPTQETNFQSFLNNFMEQSSSCEVHSSSASKDIPRILWNPKVPYLVRKNPLPLPFRNQIYELIYSPI
jgi:hypothetical protein